LIPGPAIASICIFELQEEAVLNVSKWQVKMIMAL
jgi:hypothetical protein